MSSVKPAEEDRLYRIRHSATHVMAQAVRELYPHVKLGIGPPTATGFYYDFDLGRLPDGKPSTFTPEDLEKIERRMREIIRGSHRFHYRVVTSDEARQLFKDQPYKLELIEGILSRQTDEDGNEADEQVVISTYRQDSFEDLCRGPHVEHTGKIPIDGFKILSVAGAYWRGHEKNPMLQRIYGTAWNTKEDLDLHLHALEEAKRRDHRKLGMELEIFTFDDEVGPGLPLWLPNGGILIEEIERLAKEVEAAAGYLRVRTPHVTKEDIFLRSGHLPYFAESMYPPMELEGVRYYLKPMNCPFHHKIFSSKPRSYRDLPLRLAEYGTCYRYEKSGELFGLLRVRSMQMNDAHIYLGEEQFEEEFMAVVRMYQEYFRLFGIEKFSMRLSTHHKGGMGTKYVDKPGLWEKTEDLVRQAMTRGGVPFHEASDEAAFYGPKIDVEIWSSIGREFTLATNQVDFVVPERFDLKYTTHQGTEATPLCIHRAPLSTHERLIGFLIEHYAGNFPVWLAPEQVRLIPITDAHVAYALKIVEQLTQAGVRAHADVSPQRMNAKIRNAQLMKIPYMLAVGDRELKSGTVSLRRRDGTQENDVSTDTFFDLIRKRIETRSADL